MAEFIIYIMSVYPVSASNAEIIAQDRCMRQLYNPKKTELIIDVCTDTWNTYTYNPKG